MAPGEPPDGRDRAAAPAPVLRAAVAADIPAMAAIARAAYAPYRARLDGRAPPAMTPDFAGFVARGEAVVAERAGRLLGYVLAGPGRAGAPGDPGAETWEIDNLAIAPAAQGRGLGPQLLAVAEARGRAAGFERAALLTNAVMTENQALYARLGWRETGRRHRKGTEVIDYAKALAPGG